MSLPTGVQITAPITAHHAEVLTPEAIAFITRLQRKHNARRKELLAARAVRQVAIDAGQKPDFLPETAHIRESEWTVAPLPADLLDRRVEITGPVDRKMIINALNSGAKPRSGSCTMMRVSLKLASPSSRVWPSLSPSASSSEASAQAVPGAGTSRVLAPVSAAFWLLATFRLPRKG